MLKLPSRALRLRQIAYTPATVLFTAHVLFTTRDTEIRYWLSSGK